MINESTQKKDAHKKDKNKIIFGIEMCVLKLRLLIFPICELYVGIFILFFLLAKRIIFFFIYIF